MSAYVYVTHKSGRYEKRLFLDNPSAFLNSFGVSCSCETHKILYNETWGLTIEYYPVEEGFGRFSTESDFYRANNWLIQEIPADAILTKIETLAPYIDSIYQMETIVTNLTWKHENKYWHCSIYQTAEFTDFEIRPTDGRPYGWVMPTSL